MKYLQETNEISPGNLRKISSKPMKSHKEADQICAGHQPISPRPPSNVSRTPTNYSQDTDHISPGQISNLSRAPIEYHQDIHQISPRNTSNISRTYNKYI